MQESASITEVDPAADPATGATTGAARVSQGDQPESLTRLAYHRLEEAIVRLRLEPGATVTERQLADIVELGRTPVREAIQRLAHEGLLVILPRRGIRVTEINIASQLQLLEVRREVERLVARGAARRATPQDRAGFRAIADDMDKAVEDNDDVAFMRLDRAFNDLSIVAARNEYAVKAMQMMQPLSRRFWFLHYQTVADMPLCACLHANLARAIADGRPDDAADASDRLVDYIEEFTRATFVS